jgi:hypothetical protein
MKSVGAWLLAVGGAVVAVAIGWWWITYGEVVNYGYLSWREASGCLVLNSDLCSLATALCIGSHPRLLVVYWSSALWLGLIAVSASLLTAGRARLPADTARR